LFDVSIAFDTFVMKSEHFTAILYEETEHQSAARVYKKESTNNHRPVLIFPPKINESKNGRKEKQPNSKKQRPVQEKQNQSYSSCAGRDRPSRQPHPTYQGY